MRKPSKPPVSIAKRPKRMPRPPTHHVLPDLATKTDLDQAVERLEHRIDHAVEQSEHRLTVRFFGMTLGIVGVMNAILFALLRVVH